MCTWRSSTLLKIGNNEIGRKFVGLVISLDVGIGTPCDSFHDAGKNPVFNERLKSLVINGAMLAAVACSNFAGIPVGPLAFDVSSVSKYLCTCSTVHRICSSSTGCRSSKFAKFNGEME